MKYPNDFLKVALLQSIRRKKTRLALPADLTLDQRAGLRNACMVPGIIAHFKKRSVTLTLCKVGEERVTDEFI